MDSGAGAGIKLAKSSTGLWNWSMGERNMVEFRAGD